MTPSYRRTQIYIGMEADYVDTALGKRWLDETRTISRMLYGLMQTLRSANR